jgi:hypothetical protein
MTILGFLHIELALLWDLDISIHTSPPLTGYVCDYTTDCALGNKTIKVQQCLSMEPWAIKSDQLTGLLIIINKLFESLGIPPVPNSP